MLCLQMTISHTKLGVVGSSNKDWQDINMQERGEDPTSSKHVTKEEKYLKNICILLIKKDSNGGV